MFNFKDRKIGLEIAESISETDSETSGVLS